MENENKPEPVENDIDEVESLSRRDFLHSLGKWSGAVIGGILLGGVLAPPEAKADWINRRGGWVNGRGGGGWINGRGGGGWINGGGGSWVNRRGSWINR